MNKRLLTFIILLLSASCVFAQTKWTAQTELTAIAGDDLFLVVDVTGTDTSKYITGTNVFDLIDTSLELYTILTNETGSGAGALAVFNDNPRLDGVTLAGIIADNDDMVFEIDADSDGSNKYSWTDGASAEIMSLTEGAVLTVASIVGALTGNADTVTTNANLTGEVTSVGNAATIADSIAVTNWNLTTPTITTGITITGADHNPAAAGEIRYDTTIAEMSGGVLRWFDDNSVRMLVDLETDVVDGDDDKVVAYDSAADGFYMKADADTGGSTLYNNIGDPDAAGSISFGDTETATYTTVQDTAGSFFSLINSNADVSNQNYLIDFDYSADTGQPLADFVRFQDATNVLMIIHEQGKIEMTPFDVDDALILSITPGTNLTAADAEWYGIKIDGAALDPGAIDNRIFGIGVDLSGVDLTNDPYVRGLDLKMVAGGIAIDIEEGEIHQDFTTGSDAGAEYTSYDMVIHAETLNAASTTHAIDIALSAGDPAGDVYALGTHSFIGPVKQSIGVYTTQDNLELQGRKTGGGAAWVDDVDGQECFVANADEVYLGDDAATGTQFNEIQVIMGTPGTRSINPTFWYNTAADLWTEFFPADDTLGFQQSGLIRWTLGDISGSWTNNGDPGVGESTAGWWIKIIRNENPDPGTPTPTTAKTGVITDCTWDKTGALNVVSMEAATITLGGNAVVSETVATGAMIFGDSTPDADGEFGFDTDGDGASITTGVLGAHDGTAAIYFFPVDAYPGGDNQIMKYDLASNKLVWEADADTGGNTAYDDIADPDASGSIAFDAAEAGVYTSAADEWVGITISNTQAALTGATELLTLAFTDDGDTNAHYLIMSDAAGTQQLEFIQSTADIQVTTAGDLKFIAGGGDITFADDNVTTTGTVSGGTVTDGTLSITGGEILDATTLEATTTLGIEIGDVQQLVLTDGKLNPTTDDDIDLGDATHQFKDGFFDGTLEADALTEGGNAVYSSGETPGGELGGTFASFTIDADAVSYDEIGDAAAASSISFADGETVTWATAEDSAGSFFTIDNSDAALAANTYLMHLLYSVDDDEANADYFKCEDAGGVVFTIQEYGDFGGTGDMLLDSGAADSPIIKLVNANDDEFKMQLETASNIAFQILGDTGDKFHFHLEDRGAGTGANNDITGFVVKMETETNNTLEEVSEIRTNLTDATATTTDATMEFYTAVGSSLTKSITLTGADVAVAGALTLGSDIVGEPKHFRFNLFDPLAVQTLDTQVCIVPLTSAALTITNIKITLDAAGNEVAGDLKYADTFIGLANPVVINICDTSSGVLNDSAMGTAAVPATKCVYFQFDSAPHTDITQMIWDITYDYD